MSFGTGHHATTYLMMEQMSGIDFNNMTVLDFGTGTGVLAILAEKMGAGPIMAIDNDDWSIENAIENISHNQCKNINIKKASAIESIQKYDVILANINLNVILANMPAIAAVCKKGSTVLLSGFLVADESQVKVSLTYNKLVFNRVSEKNGWICIEATAL
jgi:ribosomal protein L11 methyltransferase